MKKIEYIVTTEPSKEDVQDILDGLRKFNRSKLSKVKETDLACFSYKENGEKSGGVFGKVQGNWLLIKYLWVDETMARQGIGSELLKRLEKEAIQHGCDHGLVDTFSFQAKPFYEKHGYICQMTLENYFVSHQRHYLVKAFTQ